MNNKNISLDSIYEHLNTKVLPELMPVNDYVKRKITNTQVIQDSIWGQIYLAPWEVAMIDTPLVQRLRQIHQLGTAFLVYPSAIHDRFSHSLGVAYLAESMVSSLQNKIRYKIISLSPSDGEVISLKDAYTIKMAALLHDIGHCMFSHCSEFVLKPIWDKLYYNYLTEKLPVKPATHELTGYLILTSSYFRKYWNDIIKPVFLSNNIDEKDIPEIDDMANAITGNFISPEKHFVTEIINGPYDVDKIEYLQRDAKTAGIAITYDRERYFSKITLHKQINEQNQIIWRLAMKLDGIQAAEQMAISKMMLFPYIFRHNKVLASEFLLCNIMEKLLQGRTTNTISIKHPTDMLLYTDSDLLCYSCRSRDEALNRQLRCFRYRIFPRLAFALSKSVCLNDEDDKKFKKNFAKVKLLAKSRDKSFRKAIASYLSPKSDKVSTDEIEVFYTKANNVFEKMANAPVINYTEKMEKIKDRWLMRNWDAATQTDNDIIYFYVPAYNARFAFKKIAAFLTEYYGFKLNLDLVRDNIKLAENKKQES